MGVQEEAKIKLLQLIYRMSRGNPDEIIGRKGLGQPLGWSDKETRKVLKALTKDGLIRYILFDSLCLTHTGIVQAEQYAEQPGEIAGGVSRAEQLRKLIQAKSRRLQKLQEKQARKGINVEVEVLTEIEDLEAEIEELQAEYLQTTKT